MGATTAAVVTVAAVLGSAYFQHEQIQAEKKATKRANALAHEQNKIEQENQQAILQEELRKNRNLLAQQQSAYKAKLGASGLSTTSGSGQVVLDTMQKEADMEEKYLKQQNDYTLKRLNTNLKQTNNRNLLNLEKLKLNTQGNLFNATVQSIKTGSGSNQSAQIK